MMKEIQRKNNFKNACLDILHDAILYGHGSPYIAT